MSMNHRIEPGELQSMSIVVLRGLSEENPRLSCIGWVEDKPHNDDSAVVLQEPLYFVQPPHNTPDKTNPNPSVGIQFIVPELELPVSTEFFEYTKLEMYDGISGIAELYIKAVMYCRKMAVSYSPSWVVGDIRHVAGKVPVLK